MRVVPISTIVNPFQWRQRLSEATYKVHLQGPGIEVQREVDEGKVLQIMAIVLTSVTSSPESDHGSPTAQHSERNSPGTSRRADQPDVSIGEFLAELNISSNLERIAGIALYAKEKLDRSRITKDEALIWFQKAGEPAPKNIHRDFRKAIEQKIIAEDHNEAGQYYLTATGTNRLRRKK
jgi:hypothetical protein